MPRTTMLVLLTMLAGAALALQDAAKIEVEKLADNVYLFTHNAHRSLFVVARARGVHGLDTLRRALRHEHRRRAPRAYEVGTAKSTIARTPAAQ